MAIALIILSLVGLCLGVFAWLWLAGGALRPGWRGRLGAAALQLSMVCLVYGFVRGQPMTGVFLAMFPPLAIGEVVKAIPYLMFLKEVAIRVAPFAGAILLALLAVQRLRRWAPGAALVSALVLAPFLGDGPSLRAMCAAAEGRGIKEFARNSFLWSLANTPRDWQWEIHARAEMEGVTLGWSYRDLDWYVIPADTTGQVSGAIAHCP